MMDFTTDGMAMRNTNPFILRALVVTLRPRDFSRLQETRKRNDMALITCKDCKKKFSTDAKRCPHCGANKPAGKGCLVFVVIMIALGVLGGAQDGKPTTQSSGCKANWKSCRDNEDMANHYGDWSRITVACKMAAERSARYGTPEFPWLPFGSFRKGRDYVDTGIVHVYEEEARFQNGFGAMVHSSVTCTYDLNADKVLDIQIMPN